MPFSMEQTLAYKLNSLLIDFRDREDTFDTFKRKAGDHLELCIFRFGETLVALAGGSRLAWGA